MYLLDIPLHFFNPLTSKHKEKYLHVLFTVESILADAHCIAVERGVLVAALRHAIVRESFVIDVSDEEDFDKEQSGDFLQDNLSYIMRMFLAVGWLDCDGNGDYMTESIFITLYGKKLIDFINSFALTEDGAGFVVSTYSNLTQLKAMPDTAFICVKNAYDSAQRLLANIEMMYSRMKQYYTALLSRTKPEELLSEHIDCYVKDVIDKVLFPLKVDDSVDRYKGPILALTEDLFADTPLLEQTVAIAVQTNRVKNTQDGMHELLSMLSSIKSTFRDIENYIQQLDDKNNAHIRFTRQKLTNMLSMDTSIKGNIIALLSDSKDKHALVWQKIAHCTNVFDIKIIQDESLYKRRQVLVRQHTEEVEIEKPREVSQQDVNAVVDSFGAKFTGANVNAYAKQLLKDKTHVKAVEIEVSDDEAYLMAMFLATNSDDRRARYRFNLEMGTVIKGKYSLPKFTLERKDAINED